MAAKTAKPSVEYFDDDAGEDRIIDNAFVIADQGTPWLAAAQADIGLHEYPGRRHNARILDMFRLAGHEYVVDDETAWCAAAMCAWLEQSGTPSPKTLAARAFEKWGREISEPVPGCIVVMWRGSPKGWQGHVGIYIGEAQGGEAIRVLGGNQSDKVCIAEFAKRRKYRGKYYDAVLSYRMPRRVLRTQVASGAAGALQAGAAAASAGAIAVSSATPPMIANPAPAVGITDSMRPVAESLVHTGHPTAAQIGLWLVVALSLAAVGVSLYAYWRRGADFRARGV